MNGSPPRVIAISTGTILRVVAIALALALTWFIRDIVLYVFTAFMLAGVLHPFAEWAARYKIPKGVSVIALYLLLFSGVGLLLTFLVPALVNESRLIAVSYGDKTEWVTEIVTSLKTATDTYGLSANLRSGLMGLQGQLQSMFANVFGALGDAFGAVAGFVIVFVLSFYIIIEESAVKKLFRDIVPRAYQELATNLVWQMTHRLGDWMRGQLALCLIIGLLYLIAFVAIGVPYPVLLAVLGGLLEFVPYLGPFLSAVPVVFLAFTVSPMHAVFALVAIIIIQQLENNVIVPKIMQKAVGINPIISIIAFLVGAKLFGVLGAIFAIPLATALSLVWTEIIQLPRK
ncbi:MAG: AI-2E family transporter [Patescibacteria group bacterium]